MLKRIMSFSLVLMAGFMQDISAGDPAADKNSVNTTSLKMIQDTLVLAKSQQSSEQLETYRTAIKAILDSHSKNVLLADKLKAATNNESCEAALRYANEILSYEPKQEAKLPAGFPTPTPLGEIQIKQYPAHRLARISSQKNSGFFKLFTHIKLNRIEMTAPVEMSYASNNKNNEPEQIDMAFIYGKADLGSAGDKIGGVKVLDISALKTVSIGLKGENDQANLTEIEHILEQWLATNASEYERAGNLRVNGYNSPQVPADSRYFEVELPIQLK